MQQQRRSRFILGLLSLGLLAGVPLTAGPAQAVDAVGPYYAEPSWDQKKGAATRFVVLTNWSSAAVLDKETGLVWEKSQAVIGSGVLWSEARAHCMGNTTGNRLGWRLPSIHELKSLLDPSVASPGPFLPPGHPFLNVQSGTGDPRTFGPGYWSATTVTDTPTLTWSVRFDLLGTGAGSRTSVNNHVWCVRGGNSADTY